MVILIADEYLGMPGSISVYFSWEEPRLDGLLAECHTEEVVCVPVLGSDRLPEGNQGALEETEVVQEHVHSITEEVDIGG